jgi:hypothetical protein
MFWRSQPGRGISMPASLSDAELAIDPPRLEHTSGMTKWAR